MFVGDIYDKPDDVDVELGNPPAEDVLMDEADEGGGM